MDVYCIKLINYLTFKFKIMNIVTNYLREVENMLKLKESKKINQNDFELLDKFYDSCEKVGKLERELLKTHTIDEISSLHPQHFNNKN